MNARLFLGLPIELSTAQQLKKSLLANNQTIDRYFRWTTFENYHVTMRFLGSVDLEQLPTFIAELTQALQSVESFTMTLDRIDRFPNPRGKLLAVYVKPSVFLQNLFTAIEQAILQTDIAGKDKRSFLPHITMARPKKTIYHKHITPVVLDNVSLVIKELVLYESQPELHGSRYIPQHRFLLGDCNCRLG